MNVILNDPQLTADLFDLPNDAISHIFSSSETCIGELKLFQTIQTQIKALA